MASHLLEPDSVHYAWDNSLTPALKVKTGDVIELQTKDASGGYYHHKSTSDDVTKRPPFRGHPLSGPIQVIGAEPGDVVMVDILAIDCKDFGWSAIVPGRGFLSNDFDSCYFQGWELQGGVARIADRVAVPMRPLCGVIGLAPSEGGAHSTVPPTRTGGNLDIPQICVGTRVLLPVAVPGALLSIGDVHAAQGDGEVCNNGIETAAEVKIKVTLAKEGDIKEPQLITHTKVQTESVTCRVTAATAGSLDGAARNAVRYMITYLQNSYGLSAQESYVVCSVAGDLRISQAVNNSYTVCMFMREDIFCRSDGG